MVWQTPRPRRRTRLLSALFAAASMVWAAGLEPVGAQRARESQATLSKFLEDAAARGIAEQDITRAVFEGRLNPDYRDLELVREGLARAGDPFPAASGGREWIRRFGSIGGLQKVQTVVNGVAVVWSGRDILTHAAITSLRVSDRGNVSYRYPKLRALPDSWRMGFDDVAAQLKAEPGALDELTAYLDELDKQTDAVNYFGYSDRRSPDGATDAGPFDARLDYDTLRTAKYLRELAGQPPLPLNRASTATERTARRPQLEIEPWSYKHGAGFGTSDALRAREAAALGGKTLMLDLLVAAIGAQSGPVDVLLAAGRRADAERILKTLPGWTAARLSNSYRFTDYKSRDFLEAVMRGGFEPWLGRQPEGPNGLKDRARGWYLDLAFAGYHGEFETACPSAPGPWVAWTTWIETTQIGPFGPTGPPTVESKTTVRIREPYLQPVTVRAKVGRMAASDFAAEILRASQNGELQNLKALMGEFKRFLSEAGCTSDVTRQFEVNFYLLAEGFPPLQVLLPGVELLAERARRPTSPATATATLPSPRPVVEPSNPRPATRGGQPSTRGVVAPPAATAPETSRSVERVAPVAPVSATPPAEAATPEPAPVESDIADLTSPTEGQLTDLDLAGGSLTLRLRDRNAIVRFRFDDTTTVSALDGSARLLVRSQGQALANVRSVRLQWFPDPAAPSRRLIARITVTAMK